MQKQLDILIESRKLIVKLIKNLSIEQLNKIPKGFKNNIVWNVAHLVVTQQLLCYKLSGLDCLVSEELIANFQKGSVPSYFVSEEEFKEIKQQLLVLPNKLEEDYLKGVFKNYKEYKTSVNITLSTVDDAIKFNAFHEGIHFGIILQLLKFI